MKNFQISNADDALKALRGGMIQSLAVGGASVTIVVTNNADTFEVGSLGEVELRKDSGESRDIFSSVTDDLSYMAGSQIADVSINDSGITIKIENPSWTIIFWPGVDYAAEVSCVTKAKGPAFFF